MNRIAGLLADAVVTYTYDFGSHSPYLTKYVNQKLVVIPPPVEIAPATEQDVQTFRDKHSLEGKRIIGISARIAAEKGIEVLLAALPEIWESHPDVHVLHANPDAIGEDAYATRLKPQLEKFKDRYHLLGPLHGSELTSFYKSLDCLVMCSLNNTETFGLVQIEAMLNGVPAVASNLPGVRQPVRMTGMGEVTPVGDHRALASAVSRVLDKDEINAIPSNILQQAFSPDNSAHEYHLLFKNLKANQAMSKVTEDSPAYASLKNARDEQR